MGKIPPYLVPASLVQHAAQLHLNCPRGIIKPILIQIQIQDLLAPTLKRWCHCYRQI